MGFSKRRHIAGTILMSLLPFGSGAWGFNQPPMNLSLTSVLDAGGPILAGLYLIEYAQMAESGPAIDKDGNTIPGRGRIGAVANINQLFYLSSLKVLGGYLGADILQSMVSVSATGSLGGVPLTTNTAGFGDLVVGPAIQWNDAKILDRPYFQRTELDFVLPTGKYDPAYAANPGANILTIEDYYTFTWLFSKNWETSWRFFYAWHGTNEATQLQPGQTFHFNYDASRALTPNFRLGMAGYGLFQTTDDHLAGARIPDSRERALSAGPVFAYMNGGFMLALSHPIEFYARNRFLTSVTTLQFIYKF